MIDIAKKISEEFSLNKTYTDNIIALLDEGNTIPFIARYRKEKTGSIDDQVLRDLSERLDYLRNLEAKKEEIKNLIANQDKLTPEIANMVEQATTLSELEDVYRPFRPKRRTRATIAKEKGLEPLSEIILKQEATDKSLEDIAKAYVNPDLGVETVKDALDGAKDIIAEIVSDDAKVRRLIRNYILRNGNLTASALTDEDSVYSKYYDYSEPIIKLASHRILAVNRGEKEKILKVAVKTDSKNAIALIRSMFVKGKTIYSDFISEAVEDSYDRLIYPSVEREVRSYLTDESVTESIKTFAKNLKPLLLSKPVRNINILGFDPAFRTGCKLAAIDSTGKVLKTDVIYPTAPHFKTEESKKKLLDLITLYNIKCISLGNGTASRESEQFINESIKGTGCSLMIVNEAGASVYSASKLGAKEFPDYDVSLRSAVSIARRLSDPLAELVKIDPKSIGIGQYQHDMPPKQLDTALAGSVEDCVNMVGADLNTASSSLLSYIAGINSSIAENIVKFREENGRFNSRKDLMKVPKLGEKAFMQCAGFLRIPGAKNILDNTSVHPESYNAAKIVLEEAGYSLDDVKNNKVSDLKDKVSKIGEDKICEKAGIGKPTLYDIISSLLKPGLDPRDELKSAELRNDVTDIKDLTSGMILTGTVRNVANFGAFVDIGVHQDGLVHISELSTKYIKDPSDVVSVGDIVKVKVLDVDTKKNRISLSMKL